LQLAELRSTKPSSLRPVKDDQDRFLSFERIQIDALTLNREPGDVGCNALGLKCQQQSKNQRLHEPNRNTAPCVSLCL
jgi:hypothetical protein